MASVTLSLWRGGNFVGISIGGLENFSTAEFRNFGGLRALNILKSLAKINTTSMFVQIDLEEIKIVVKFV